MQLNVLLVWTKMILKTEKSNENTGISTATHRSVWYE